MISRLLLAIALLAGAACGAIPKDPDGTLDRVRAERQFRVGLIASGAPVGADRQKLFLQGVGRAAGARPAIETGASDPLLAKLEEGELDVVVGEFAPQSPWALHVTMLPLLGEQISREGHVHLAAAARNGENAWIALLHEEAGKVAAQR